jgi:hypothetical protein
MRTAVACASGITFLLAVLGVPDGVGLTWWQLSVSLDLLWLQMEWE